jgi:hypothetical protein
MFVRLDTDRNLELNWPLGNAARIRCIRGIGGRERKPAVEVPYEIQRPTAND